MNSSKKLDHSYQKDHHEFIEKLQEFHSARGTSIGRIPTFGGQVLDLYALYNTVTSFGGISVVTERKKWDQVFMTLGFPPCTNAAYALRQHYARYLEAYEKIFFFGEDTEDTNEPYRTHAQLLKYRRLNKPPHRGPLGEPLVNNFNRISFSLQSGLQNEVDFALNICSLLSNVTNSIFNLAKSPNILDLLLAHVGICSSDSFTKELYNEWYSTADSRFEKFWLKSLKEPIATQIYKEYFYDDCDKDISIDSNLFAKKNDKNHVISQEHCRVNQICIILYNFSFELINAMHIASHDSAIRFLLLSSCCIYNNIRRTGLDALDNISDHIDLTGIEDSFTQDFVEILYKLLLSSDKFCRVRSMTILSKLLSCKKNTDILTNSVPEDVYGALVRTLALPDISLILSSLDALYSLSISSKVGATAIAMVHGSVDTLVCLVTVRAESYGNRAIRGFRIVENKHSMFTAKNQHWLKAQEEKRRQQLSNQHHHPMMMTTPNAPPNYPRIPLHPGYLRPSLPMPHLPHQLPQPPPPPQMNPMMNLNANVEPLVELDPEIFTVNWMSGFYEPHPTNKLPVSTIYEDYVNTCKENKRNGILSKEGFVEILRSILPPQLAQIVRINEDGDVGINGIQRRSAPAKISSKIPKSIHEHLLRNKKAISSIPKGHPPPPQLANAGERPPTPTTIELSQAAKDDANNVTISEQVKELNSEKVKQMEKNVESPKIEAREGFINGLPPLDKLKTVVECQEVVEKLKVEIHGHFVQFHAHRQQIQVVQMQVQHLMQQSQVENLPSHVVKDIQARVQTHHQQMGIHYQRLQELNVLSEQVQNKMQSYKATEGSDLSEPTTPSHQAQSTETRLAAAQPRVQQYAISPMTPNSIHTRFPVTSFPSSPNLPLTSGAIMNRAASLSSPVSVFANTNTSSGTPTAMMSPHILNALQPQTFVVPPATTLLPQGGMVTIQHGIPSTILSAPPFASPPSTPTRGSRGGRMARGSASPKGKGSRGGRGFRGGKGSRGGRGTLGSPLNAAKKEMENQQSLIINGVNPHVSAMHLPFVQSPLQEIHSPIPNMQAVVMSHGLQGSRVMQPITTPSTQQTNAPQETLTSNPVGSPSVQPPSNSIMQQLVNNPSQPVTPQVPHLNNVNSLQTFSESHLTSPRNICSPTNILVEDSFNKARSQLQNGHLKPVIQCNGDITKLEHTHHAGVTHTKSPDSSVSQGVDFTKLNGSTTEALGNKRTGDCLKDTTPLKKVRMSNNDSLDVLSPVNELTGKHLSRLINMCDNDRAVGRVEIKDVALNGNSEKELPSVPEKSTGTEIKLNGNNHEEATLCNGKVKELDDGVSQVERDEKENRTNVNCSDTIESDEKANQNDVVEADGENLDKDNGKGIRTHNALGMLTENQEGRKNYVCANKMKENIDTDGNLPVETRDTDELNKNIHHVCLTRCENGMDVISKPPPPCNGETSSIVNNVNDNKPENPIPGNKLNGLRLDLISSSSEMVTQASCKDTSESITTKLLSDSSLVDSTGETFLTLEKPPSTLNYCSCEWKDCTWPPFKSAVHLLTHMIRSHAPLEGKTSICKVLGCATSTKPRGALICHFKEKHCLTKNEDGTSTVVPVPNHLYSKYKEHEDESPVTRSVRYTAALILRNIARNSAYGKTLITTYEQRLSVVAMSTSEAASAATQCLLELSQADDEDDEES